MTMPARGKRPNQRGMTVAARSSAACAYASIASRVRKLNLESPRSRFSIGVTSRDPKLRSVMPRISASSPEPLALIRHLARDVEGNRLPAGEGLRAQLVRADGLNGRERRDDGQPTQVHVTHVPQLVVARPDRYLSLERCAHHTVRRPFGPPGEGRGIDASQLREPPVLARLPAPARDRRVVG